MHSKLHHQHISEEFQEPKLSSKSTPENLTTKKMEKKHALFALKNF
jgi:hypothetical protein